MLNRSLCRRVYKNLQFLLYSVLVPGYEGHDRSDRTVYFFVFAGVNSLLLKDFFCKGFSQIY